MVTDKNPNPRWPSVFEVAPYCDPVETGTRARRIKRPWLALLFIGLASMVAQGFGRFTFPVLLTAIDRELLGSYTLAGFLSNVPLVAYLLGTGVTSYLSTRTDPSDLIKIGVTLSAIGLGSMAVSPNSGTLALALFIAGFGAVDSFLCGSRNWHNSTGKLPKITDVRHTTRGVLGVSSYRWILLRLAPRLSFNAWASRYHLSTLDRGRSRKYQIENVCLHARNGHPYHLIASNYGSIHRANANICNS